MKYFASCYQNIPCFNDIDMNRIFDEVAEYQLLKQSDFHIMFGNQLKGRVKMMMIMRTSNLNLF